MFLIDKMRELIIILILILSLGCANRSLKYDRNKILAKYSADYEILLDNQRFNFETTYLDKANIDDVRIDKQNGTVIINQIKRDELIGIKELIRNKNSLSATNTKEIELVIIDGLPLSDSLIMDLRIDPNAIESLSILPSDSLNDMNWCKGYDGDIMLIVTR